MKKLFKLAAVIAVFSYVFTACAPAGQPYDKNGLSFNYPEGWTITADEYNGGVGYLSISKDGATPPATVTFGWMESDAQIGADMMLANIFTEMQKTETFVDLVREDPLDVTYGPYPARAITYTATIDGVPCAGAVWVFAAEGRVVNVAVREGTDKAGAADFKMVKESFELK
jgi:hypothetical protein